MVRRRIGVEVGARPFDRIGVFALVWAVAFLLIAAGLAAALG